MLTPPLFQPLLAVAPVVKTVRDLDALAVHTHILAVIVALAFIALAAVIAQAIKFEGGRDARDVRKRRTWFWVLLAVCVASLFVYNFYVVAPRVAIGLQSRFMTVNALSAGIAFASYIVAGFVISKVFSTSKLANWFGSSR